MKMRKIITAVLVLTVAAGLQSCWKRSPDAVAKDYCENVARLMEQRDIEGTKPYTQALKRYRTKLNLEELEQLQRSILKYMEELRYDSLVDEVMLDMHSDDPEHLRPGVSRGDFK